MTNLSVIAGVCGFRTDINATTEDGQMVVFQIRTECDDIRRFSELLAPVDAYDEIGKGFDGAIHQTAKAALKGCCSGCVVPNGVFKAMQVCSGLALPSDISLKFDAS